MTGPVPGGWNDEVVSIVLAGVVVRGVCGLLTASLTRDALRPLSGTGLVLPRNVHSGMSEF